MAIFIHANESAPFEHNHLVGRLHEAIIVLDCLRHQEPMQLTIMGETPSAPVVGVWSRPVEPLRSGVAFSSRPLFAGAPSLVGSNVFPKEPMWVELLVTIGFRVCTAEVIRANRCIDFFF